jgi:hypothetical protein
VSTGGVSGGSGAQRRTAQLLLLQGYTILETEKKSVQQHEAQNGWKSYKTRHYTFVVQNRQGVISRATVQPPTRGWDGVLAAHLSRSVQLTPLTDLELIAFHGREAQKNPLIRPRVKDKETIELLTVWLKDRGWKYVGLEGKRVGERGIAYSVVVTPVSSPAALFRVSILQTTHHIQWVDAVKQVSDLEAITLTPPDKKPSRSERRHGTKKNPAELTEEEARKAFERCYPHHVILSSERAALRSMKTRELVAYDLLTHLHSRRYDWWRVSMGPNVGGPQISWIRPATDLETIAVVGKASQNPKFRSVPAAGHAAATLANEGFSRISFVRRATGSRGPVLAFLAWKDGQEHVVNVGRVEGDRLAVYSRLLTEEDRVKLHG